MKLELAERLLGIVRAAAQQAGLNLAAWVVDTGGHSVAMFRMDGCRLLTAEVARGKAYTAASFRMESARVALVAQKDPLMWQSIVSATDNKMVLGAGAFPIVVEGVVVGALGVSGGTADQDAEVARAAMAAAGLLS